MSTRTHLERQNIICDLDGTLALIDHRRHFVVGKHKNYDKFHAACDQDIVNVPIQTILQELNELGYVLYITSGRMETVRDKTEAWLKENGIQYEMLLMRKEGDYTPDHELKRQWLHTLLPKKETILLVFDDRDRVVQMWRDEGLTCVQVAPGNF